MPSQPDVFELPPLPDEQSWSRLGLRLVAELHGGWQSRVFRVSRDGTAMVVKLTDRRVIDDAFHRRLEIVDRLADALPQVVGPIRFGADLSVDLVDWVAVGYPLVSGVHPDPRSGKDVAGMAAALSMLHRQMATLADDQLPPVVALRDCGADRFGAAQLVHGDYSAANVPLGAQLQILDFDGCGRGSIEFEVADTLYMVLFDATMAAKFHDYEVFRDRFVAAYRSDAAVELDDEVLDEAIAHRIDAPRSWLETPETAPIGIRAASPAWHRELWRFIERVAPMTDGR